MFQDITSKYDGTDATMEILVMLLVAFILGIILGYLLRPWFNKHENENAFHELDEDRDRLSSELAQLQADNEKLTTAKIECERTKQTLGTEKEKLNSEILALKSNNENLQAEIRGLKTDLSSRASSAQPVPLMSTSTPKDDLKQIEGIGPKIEQLLNADGITTFVALSKAKIPHLKEILKNAGERFRMHDPSTWPRQAKMAAKGEWVKLVRWQDKLDGGRE